MSASCLFEAALDTAEARQHVDVSLLELLPTEEAVGGAREQRLPRGAEVTEPRACATG